jgi:hypothetical protein
MSLGRGPGYVRLVTNCNNGLYRYCVRTWRLALHARCDRRGQTLRYLPLWLLLINAFHSPVRLCQKMETTQLCVVRWNAVQTLYYRP